MLHPENQVLSYEAISGNSTFQSETDIRVVLPESAFDRIVSAINGNDANRVSSSVEAFFADLYQKVRHRQLLSVCLYRLADVVRKIASSYGIEAGRVILDFTRAVGSHNPNCKKLAHVMCIHLFNKLNEHSDKPINLLENEIIEYIKKNYRRKSFSIQHISERFSLPTMVISKIVKKKTGKKFNDYVNYLRIEYAKTLFASEDIKTTAVCCDSGYSDYGYFSRKFKQFTGVLPSTYKKRYN
jgi:two-component system response regulator YesN